MTDNFIPFHMSGTKEDLAGNHGIGRYIFLCGSDERAKKIASHFDNLIVKEHERQHHFYLGRIQHQGVTIDVASISTGVGCPSADNIINELYLLGGRRFLRVGTAGSLQPKHIKVGDVVIATGAVRDEDTSACYVTTSYPAIASIDMVNAAQLAVQKLGLNKYVYQGIVHTKSSFYAREMGQSYLKSNKDYMEDLKMAGVLATEMECSHLFIVSSLFSHREAIKSNKLAPKVSVGGILAIVGDDTPISSEEAANTAVDRAINIGFECIKELAISEIKF